MGRSLVKCLLWGLIVLVHLHGYRGCFEEERMGLLEIKEEFVRSTPNETIINHLPPPRRVYILGILPSWVDDHKNMVWFPNVSLFESLKELRSLDLSFNAIGGWIEHKVSANK
nr:hypothetical protein CFP56_75469 [Quercus suber]